MKETKDYLYRRPNLWRSDQHESDSDDLGKVCNE